MRVVVLSLIGALLIAAPGRAAPQGETLLFSFEAPAELRSLQARSAQMQVVRANVDHGRSALRIEFQPDRFPNVIFSPRIVDWRPYGGLGFHLFNPDAEPANFQIRIDDNLQNSGNSRSSTGTLGPRSGAGFALMLNPQPVEVGMQGLPPYPGLRPLMTKGSGAFDLGHIVRFQIFMASPPRARRLIVDNVRLLPPLNFQGIIDPFGQYTRENWPGKLSSAEEFASRIKAEQADLEEHPPAADRDEFGGWAAGPQLEASGVFRTEKVQDRWSLVTPSGHLFLSLGFNTTVTAQPTMVTGREEMFVALPVKNDSLAKFYEPVEQVHWGPRSSGESFDFYGANLARKYGLAEYDEAWFQSLLARYHSWGFNTAATRRFTKNKPEMQTVPYVVSNPIVGKHARVSSGSDYWGKIHDPFDPQFAIDVRESLEKVAPHIRDDPWFLGYFIDNELSWIGNGPGGRYGLALGTLAAPATQPAKAAWLQQLKERYHDINQLNRAWGQNLGSWAQLEATWRPAQLTAGMRGDSEAFLLAFARQYFRTVHTELRQLDPKHLYLGCRFSIHSPESVQAAAEFCDVVSFNIYAMRVDPVKWAFLNQLNKPCLVSEFHSGALDRGMFAPGLVSVPNQEARARMYADYVNSVLDHPAMVGCHWYQYADQPTTGKAYTGENFAVGFVSVSDTPYPEIVAAARAVHAGAYSRRFGALAKP